MSDIMQRLRSRAADTRNNHYGVCDAEMDTEAADEIERLEKERDEAREARDEYIAANVKLRAEIERLRAENDVLHKTDKWRYETVLTLKAKIERLTAALKPFAKMYAAPGGDLDRAIQDAHRALEGK